MFLFDDILLLTRTKKPPRKVRFIDFAKHSLVEIEMKDRSYYSYLLTV